MDLDLLRVLTWTPSALSKNCTEYSQSGFHEIIHLLESSSCMPIAPRPLRTKLYMRRFVTPRSFSILLRHIWKPRWQSRVSVTLKMQIRRLIISNHHYWVRRFHAVEITALIGDPAIFIPHHRAVRFEKRCRHVVHLGLLGSEVIREGGPRFTWTSWYTSQSINYLTTLNFVLNWKYNSWLHFLSQNWKAQYNS